MKKVSYRSSIPKIPKPVKNLPSLNGGEGPTLSSAPGSSTEGAGRNGFNLQELSRDIDGVQPDLYDKDIPRDSSKSINLHNLIQLMITMGDEMDEENEELLANFADFMLVKCAEVNAIDQSAMFNDLLLRINDSDQINTNDSIIALVMLYSKAIKTEELGGNTIEGSKDKAYRIALKHSERMLSNPIEPKVAQLLANNSKYVADQIADIIKVMIGRMSLEARPRSFQNLKRRLIGLNPSDLSNKRAPGGALIGTSITLVKNILNGRDPFFIHSVLRELSSKL